jgi:hypothetical protein
MARLAAATGSVSSAQSLLDTALNVSASSGADLATSVGAIIKATSGQFKALKSLVPSLSAATIKSKDFRKALEEVNKATAGAAATRAGTLEYRLAGLRIAFGEILETLGYALLPIMERFATTISTKILPQLEAFISANKDELAASFQIAANFAVGFLEVAIKFGDWVSNNTGKVKALAVIIAGMFVVSGIASFLTAIGTITAAYALLASTATGAAIAAAFATGGVSAIAGAAAVAGITAAVYGANKAGYYGGGDNAKATPTYKPTTNGYLGSMPIGSAKSTSNPVLASVISGPGSDLEKFLAGLGKTMNTTAKASKALLTEKQKELNLKLKELGIVTTEQQDAITQMAIIRNAERQKRLSGSSTIALGGSGSLAYNKGSTVIINNQGSVVTEQQIAQQVTDGQQTLARRNGGGGDLFAGRSARAIL